MAEQTIGVGMIGLGTVGGGVARLLSEQAELYAQRTGVRISLRAVLVRDTTKHRDPSVPGPCLTSDPEQFFRTADMPILVEVAGGRGAVSQHVHRALAMGKHLVTANKSLLAAEGADLFQLARKNKASIAFEASCCGGIPVITAMQFGLMANRIQALYGILNGTCNYILTQMTQHGESYAAALSQAQALGFAEADPTLDVSGRDAAQKLAVLASLAFGLRVTDEQVWSEGIDTLQSTDIQLGSELGYDVKLLAIAQQNTPENTREADSNPNSLSLRVHPCFVRKDCPLAQVRGSFNALSVYGDAVGHSMYLGRGAGQLPTASAVVSDILNVASGWYPLAFERMNLWCDRHEPAQPIDPDNLTSRFYLRIQAKDAPGVLAKVAAILGQAGISISAVLQHEVDADQFVPVVITTHSARQGALRRALTEISRLDVVASTPVCIRIVDLPGD